MAFKITEEGERSAFFVLIPIIIHIIGILEFLDLNVKQTVRKFKRLGAVKGAEALPRHIGVDRILRRSKVGLGKSASLQRIDHRPSIIENVGIRRVIQGVQKTTVTEALGASVNRALDSIPHRSGGRGLNSPIYIVADRLVRVMEIPRLISGITRIDERLCRAVEIITVHMGRIVLFGNRQSCFVLLVTAVFIVEIGLHFRVLFHCFRHVPIVKRIKIPVDHVIERLLQARSLVLQNSFVLLLLEIDPGKRTAVRNGFSFIIEELKDVATKQRDRFVGIDLLITLPDIPRDLILGERDLFIVLALYVPVISAVLLDPIFIGVIEFRRDKNNKVETVAQIVLEGFLARILLLFVDALGGCAVCGGPLQRSVLFGDGTHVVNTADRK